MSQRISSRLLFVASSVSITRQFQWLLVSEGLRQFYYFGVEHCTSKEEMADDEGDFDPCECSWNIEAAMRRLISLVNIIVDLLSLLLFLS